MATIGTFTENNGFYAGTITTLTLKADVVFEPVKKSSTNAPDYKLNMPGTDFEIGAAWNKTSKEGNPYLSVVLDDPSFSKPVLARLVAVNDSEYRLFWNR